MSITYTCDYCQSPIERDDPSVALESKASMNAVAAGWTSGWLGHYHLDCYRPFREAVVELRGERTAPAPTPEQQETEFETYMRRSRAWKALPYAGKVHHIRNAIGDDRLTLRELTQQVNEANPEIHVDESSLVNAVRDLVAAGEWDRVKEARHPVGKQWRWRYSQKSVELSPELEALQRALDEEAS
ncbi:MAG: hypothetical protein ACR2NV_11625 [Thermoleophilaceae bacterium]